MVECKQDGPNKMAQSNGEEDLLNLILSGIDVPISLARESKNNTLASSLDDWGKSLAFLPAFTIKEIE